MRGCGRLIALTPQTTLLRCECSCKGQQQGFCALTPVGFHQQITACDNLCCGLACQHSLASFRNVLSTCTHSASSPHPHLHTPHTSDSCTCRGTSERHARKTHMPAPAQHMAVDTSSNLGACARTCDLRQSQALRGSAITVVPQRTDAMDPQGSN